MIREIRYRGAYITDAGLPGESKAEGFIPHHPGLIRVAPGRWVVFFTTLDSKGWDAVQSVLYQLRANAPDGPVLASGVLAAPRDDWDPLGRGDQWSKRHGTPIPFGMPKGAARNGRPLPNANRFAVHWYRYAHLRRNGELLNPVTGRGTTEWREGLALHKQVMRLEWAQFRLRDDERDIEILQPPQVMRQNGFDSDLAYCAGGDGFAMNSTLTPPLPLNDDCTEWVEFDVFSTDHEIHVPHGTVQAAPVRFRFNTVTGLYEWVETGCRFDIPGRRLGESSLVRLGDDWLLAFRTWNGTQATFFYRFSDPFGDLGRPRQDASGHGPDEGPRLLYRCADGRLRLFGHRRALSPTGTRDPLWMWEIHPDSLGLGEPRVVAASRDCGLPFQQPYLHMPKLAAPDGDRQLILFSAVTRRLISNEEKTPASPSERDAAGIHYADLLYDEVRPGDAGGAREIMR